MPVLASLVSNEFVEISDDPLRPPPVNPLSEQEHRVLRRFADGRSPVDIARELEISAQTLRITSVTSIRSLARTTDSRPVTHAIRRKLI